MTGRVEAEVGFVKVEVKLEANGESGCNINDGVEVKEELITPNDEDIEIIFKEVAHENGNNNENYLDYIYTEASFLQSVSGVNSDLLGMLIDIELECDDDCKKEVVKDEKDDQFVDFANQSLGHLNTKCKIQDSVNQGPIDSEIGHERDDETGNLFSYRDRDDNQLQNDNKVRNTCAKLHKCDTCGKSFAYRSILDKHMFTHTGEKPYPCNMCEKSFSNQSNLKVHESIHTGVRPFRCAECKSSFSSSSNLKAHQVLHTGLKPFSCLMCDKTFAHPSNLKIHEKIHIGDKSYSCGVCEKVFATSSNLVKHERMHTGEKPYSCIICERSFRSSSNLKQHEIIHTGEKPYSCEVCDRSFVNAGNLKQHEMSHNCRSQEKHFSKKVYSCGLCEKSFASSGNLRIHERVHTGEKPYSCDRCDKSFRSASNLNQHEKVHTGEKPYSCDVCEKSLTSFRNLKKHQLSHDRVKSDGLPIPSNRKSEKLMKKKSINSWVINRNYSKRLNNPKASSAIESSPNADNNLSDELDISDYVSNSSSSSVSILSDQLDISDNDSKNDEVLVDQCSAEKFHNESLLD